MDLVAIFGVNSSRDGKTESRKCLETRKTIGESDSKSMANDLMLKYGSKNFMGLEVYHCTEVANNYE